MNLLWRLTDVECFMDSCCSGAELQIRRADGEILVRELYPMKSDVYERARILHEEYMRRETGRNTDLV
jgi:hypothetical protein